MSSSSMFVFAIFPAIYANVEGGIVHPRAIEGLSKGSDVDVKDGFKEKVEDVTNNVPAAMPQPEILDEFNSTLLANLGIEKDGYGRFKRQIIETGPIDQEVEKQWDALDEYEEKEIFEKCSWTLIKIQTYFKNTKNEIGDATIAAYELFGGSKEKYMKDVNICKHSMDFLIKATKSLKEAAKLVEKKMQKYTESFEIVLNRFLKEWSDDEEEMFKEE